MPSPGDLQSAAISGSLWVGLATVVGVPLGLAGTVVAARVLGPQSFGLLTLLLFVFPLVASALDLGFGAVAWWLVSANSLRDRGKVHEAISSYSSWSLCKLPVLLLAGVFLIGRRPLEFAVFGLISAGYLYLSVIQLALAAERQFKAGSLLNLIGTAASTAALVSAAYATHDYRICFLAATGGRLVVIPFVAHALNPGVFRASLHPGKIRLATEMRSYALASYVSYLTGLWVFGRSETIFLNAAGRMVDLGRFSAAATISARATLVSDALYSSLDPSIVALRSVHSEVSERAFIRTTRFGCIVGVLTAVVVMPVAVLVAPVLFGSDYERLSAPIVALTIASIVWTAVGPVNAWVTATRNTRAMVVPGLVAAVVDAALAAVLCPVLGLAGAVIASVAGIATVLTTLVIFGVDGRRDRIEVVRCATYVALIALVAGICCLGASGLGLGLALALAASYAATVTTSYVVLRFLLPPVAAASDVEAIARAAPSRLRPSLSAILSPFSGADT